MVAFLLLAMLAYFNLLSPSKSFPLRVAARCLYTQAISKIEKLSLSYYSYNPLYLTEKHCNPLIAIHGLYTSKEYFYDISSALSKKLHRPIYVVDMRDHGESPHGSFGAEATLMIIAQDIRNFMDELAIGRATIIGYGLGGRVMVQFVQLNECRVEKLVSIDISQEGSHMFSKNFSKHLHYLDKIKLNSHSNLGHAKLVMKSILHGHIKNPSILKFVLDNIRLNAEGKFEWRFNASVLEKMLTNWSHVKEINYAGHQAECKLMNIVTKNNYITAEDYLDFKTYFKHCQVEHLRSRFISTNKAAFIDAIEKFVRS